MRRDLAMASRSRPADPGAATCAMVEVFDDHCLTEDQLKAALDSMLAGEPRWTGINGDVLLRRLAHHLEVEQETLVPQKQLNTCSK